MAQLDDGTGTASPYQGGGSGAAGGANDVELTFGDVEKIGGDTAALAGDATAAKAALADARGHSAAFGSYPPARALYEHHQAVVNVFTDTLAAIATDLDDFGNTIVQAAHAYEQTDDDAAASLASVASRLDTIGLTNKNTEARNQQGETLDDVVIKDPEALAEKFPHLDGVVDVLEDARGDADSGSGFQNGDKG